jgi:NDP-sugar pyrophosphorylase family protein
MGTSATVLLFEAPRNELHRFGIADIENKSDFTLINYFIEKPRIEDAPSNLANGGYYILEIDDVLGMFPREKTKVEQSLFPELAKQGKLAGFVTKLPFWLDISTIEAYENASNMAHQGMIIPPPIPGDGNDE